MRILSLLIAVFILAVQLYAFNGPAVTFDIEYRCYDQKMYNVSGRIFERYRGNELANQAQSTPVKLCYKTKCPVKYFYVNSATPSEPTHKFRLDLEHSCTQTGKMTRTQIKLESGKAPITVNICIDLSYAVPKIVPKPKII